MKSKNKSPLKLTNTDSFGPVDAKLPSSPRNPPPRKTSIDHVTCEKRKFIETEIEIPVNNTPEEKEQRKENDKEFVCKCGRGYTRKDNFKKHILQNKCGTSSFPSNNASVVTNVKHLPEEGSPAMAVLIALAQNTDENSFPQSLSKQDLKNLAQPYTRKSLTLDATRLEEFNAAWTNVQSLLKIKFLIIKGKEYSITPEGRNFITSRQEFKLICHICKRKMTEKELTLCDCSSRLTKTVVHWTCYQSRGCIGTRASASTSEKQAQPSQASTSTKNWFPSMLEKYKK